MREHLPDERQSVIHRFVIIDKDSVEHKGYIQVGVYEDGRVGEIFVKLGKPGQESAWIDQWAISTSVALQFGAPFETFIQKFVGARFEPAGATQCKEIPRVTSLVDYCARWLLLKFGKTPEEISKSIVDGEQADIAAGLVVKP